MGIAVSLQNDELSMILAALRLWQSAVNDGSELLTPDLIEVAMNGTGQMLDDFAIDRLCEKLNTEG